MIERKVIALENTNFIYKTNFSGDPARDERFGSDVRKGNIIIPDPLLARELAEEGFNVKQTRPAPGDEDDFVPTYFVPVKVNYDTQWPPKIYIVSGNSDPVLLDEESITMIDTCYVRNVNAVLSPYRNKRTGTMSLYVKTMYVEQDIDDDPFASRYSRRNSDHTPENDEELPF